MEKTSIAIVDDQLLFRQGLASLIDDVEDFELMLEAETGSQLLQSLRQMPVLPEVLLMDMKLPDMNGVQLNQVMQKEFSSVKVIVVSMYGQDRFIYRMIEAGACGYLVKNCDKEELVTAIHTARKSGFYFNQQTLRAMRNAEQYKNRTFRNINNIPVELTKREEEILLHICREYNSTEIAQKLFLSVRTVEGHRNNLLLKTGCRNTAGLLLFAVRNEMFDIL
jgi:DNA-binding NarL/FixJ family response regulator